MSNRSVQAKSRYITGCKGGVLVLVLIVLAMMTAVTMGLAYRTRLELRMVHAYAQRTQAHYLALGGVQRIVALLKEQALDAPRVAWVSRFNTNAMEEKLFEQVKYNEEIAQFQLHYCVSDEQAFFHLNGQFMKTFEDMLGRELTAKIVDWTDQDEEPVDYDGAETSYYTHLSPEYTAKNSTIGLLRELLFLKDIDYQQYVGEDLNNNNQLDENERDGLVRFPEDNEDNSLDMGLAKCFTSFGQDRLNINTVSPALLAFVGGFDSDAALKVDLIRVGDDGMYGTEDDHYFEQTRQINIPGLTTIQQSILRDTSKFCFSSQYFRVFSRAGAGASVHCYLMATIDCSSGQPKVISLERLL